MDREQTIAVWDGGVRMRVLSAGAGPALVFLHGPLGLAWDSFLDDLARSFTVYAPEHPGTTPEAHDDIYRLDGLWDLILCHDELLTALKIEEALVVGHSFGGMVACELAAAYPRRVRRLALIDPIGLWRDTDPIVNWVKLSPAELPNYIFRNPTVEAAQQMFGPSEPPDAAIAARVRLMWAMGATSKFIWPIPDKGLKKRIHRVSAPTLIVWGADDRLVPSIYADEFSKRLARARVHIITGAGHAPHLEHPAAIAGLVRDFLTATPH